MPFCFGLHRCASKTLSPFQVYPYHKVHSCKTCTDYPSPILSFLYGSEGMSLSPTQSPDRNKAIVHLHLGSAGAGSCNGLCCLLKSILSPSVNNLVGWRLQTSSYPPTLLQGCSFCWNISLRHWPNCHNIRRWAFLGLWVPAPLYSLFWTSWAFPHLPLRRNTPSGDSPISLFVGRE